MTIKPEPWKKKNAKGLLHTHLFITSNVLSFDHQIQILKNGKCKNSPHFQCNDSASRKPKDCKPHVVVTFSIWALEKGGEITSDINGAKHVHVDFGNGWITATSADKHMQSLALQISVFRANAGKYGPEKLQIRTLFTQWVSATFLK